MTTLMATLPPQPGVKAYGEDTYIGVKATCACGNQYGDWQTLQDDNALPFDEAVLAVIGNLKNCGRFIVGGFQCHACSD